MNEKRLFTKEQYQTMQDDCCKYFDLFLDRMKTIKKTNRVSVIEGAFDFYKEYHNMIVNAFRNDLISGEELNDILRINSLCDIFTWKVLHLVENKTGA